MNVLYISYDGALDPLGSSQIIPYLRGMAEAGKIDFTFLTYEKKDKLRDKERVAALKKSLSDSGIDWQFLKYHKYPAVPATIFDIACGTVKVFIIYLRKKIRLIHARSFIGAIPALFLSAATGTKMIFDMRGFWPDEKVDAGAWKKNGLVYRVTKRIQKYLLLQASRVVVLSSRAKELLENSLCLNGKISVIPTCADLRVFNLSGNNIRPRELRASEGRFTFIYLGSLGSWYMFEEMVDFFKASLRYFASPLFVFLTNNDRNEIEPVLTRKGLSAGDYIIARVAHSQVNLWLSCANASVSFIKPVYSKIASCPTKFAESLASGVPVVINSGIGDTAGIVRNEKVGSVVEEFNLNSYNKALEWLKQSTLDKEPLRQRCRRTAEKYFSLDSGVNSYLNIYAGLNKD